MSDFISFLPAPGYSISKYDRTRPASEQPASIPLIFIEAMSIREDVFVKEQGVPLENELDEDDQRSFHWVICASVCATSSQSPDATRAGSPSGSEGSDRRRSSGGISRKAVGTLRLVPPPHPPHPEPGSHHKIDNAEVPADKIASLPSRPDHSKSALHNGTEPYVKLGRLAILPGYRSHGLARLVVHTALQWAAKNSDTILPSPSPAQIEKDKLAGKVFEPWNGLVLVHAQTSVVGFWQKYGFELDEGMGVWYEEGIEHVGLWKRVKVEDGPFARRFSI